MELNFNPTSPRGTSFASMNGGVDAKRDGVLNFKESNPAGTSFSSTDFNTESDLKKPVGLEFSNLDGDSKPIAAGAIEEIAKQNNPVDTKTTTTTTVVKEALPPVSNEPASIKDSAIAGMPTWMIIAPLLGAGVGALYAHKKSPNAMGYIGFATIGGLVAAVPAMLWMSTTLTHLKGLEKNILDKK